MRNSISRPKNIYRSEFHWELSGDILSIVDEGGGVSVTNDMENILADIYFHHNIDFKKCLIIYKDSMGLWDAIKIIDIDGSRFEFVALQEKEYQKAVEKVRSKRDLLIK